MIGSSGLLSSVYAYLLKNAGPEEDQQVAGDVNDQIEEKGEAGDADEDLRADREAKTRDREVINPCSLLLRRRARAS